MSDIATTELTEPEARSLTDEIRRDLDGLLPKIKRAFEGRADQALGYQDWAAYCTNELSSVRVPLGDRPAMVAELRQSGMTTRAIGSALGVSDMTVRRDLAGATSVAPAKVKGLDGKQYTPPPSPAARFESAVAEFPELAHYADRPAKAASLADQLRTFDPAEQVERRKILGRVIQAEKEGRLSTRPDPSVAALELADQVFVAANGAAQAVEKAGGVRVIAAAIEHADSMQIELWRDQFASLAELCTAIADACRPQLRRVQ